MFDLHVAERWLDLPLPAWHRIHDTKLMLSYVEPYAPDFSLKASAERLLNMRPTERDRLQEWMVLNIPEARRKPTAWGEYIAQAPAQLVQPYADGDCVRTQRLFEHSWQYCAEHKMLEAYDRDRQLLPILLRNSQRGVPVNLQLLEKDYLTYREALVRADQWLKQRLHLPKDANVDSDAQMAEAFLRCNIVTGFKLTPKSHRLSLSKDNLTIDMVRDKCVWQVFSYRKKLSTCLGTFFESWLEQARETEGVLHVRWNQVRGEGGGACTGRMSTNDPNLLNLPKQWQKAIDEGYKHPGFVHGLPRLPFMRRYLIAGNGCLWGRRDYNQQELRILAHFEHGDLLRRYKANPRLDIHEAVRQGLFDLLQLKLTRDSIKIINFADIYGSGTAALARRINVDIGTAHRIRIAKNRLLPGVQYLAVDIKRLAKNGEAIRTWGGRVYYCQPPAFSKKYQCMMNFEYKLLNYLIQGSAADCIKQSIINYDQHPRRRGEWLVAVHDENDVALPDSNSGVRHEMQVLREAMEAVQFDVPMLTDGEVGPSCGELEKWRDP
jgi:DNA polymerase I-like protein with 3'-5' exonuclease and polymerase domains